MGDLFTPYSSPKGGCAEVGVVRCSRVAAIGQEVMALNCARGSSGWRLGNISTPKEQCCSGTAAQGGGGVTIPAGVKECGDVALSDVGSGHGGVGWGWTWGSQRSFPT